MGIKNILITGGCGFIGSNLAIMLKEKYDNYHIICLDNLIRNGSQLNVSRIKEAGIEFIHADVRDISNIGIKQKIDVVIDAAAEPSVMAGANMDSSLDYVIGTNFNGTVNVLNLAIKTKAKFIYLSTSRVYPIQYLENINYTENDSRFLLSEQQEMRGVSRNGINEFFSLDKARSIYGTTKLASELIIQEYGEYFELEYVTNRLGVVAGPYQMGKVDQGVIALWVARHFWKKDISYFGYGGTGKQVRDVLHISDLFNLIDYQIHNFSKVNGCTFNVGGGLQSSVSLKELTKICAEITGNKVKEHAISESRKGDIPIYITDNEKILAQSGWFPNRGITDIVEDIFRWISKDQKQLEEILNR